MPFNIPTEMYILKACTCIYANPYLATRTIEIPQRTRIIKASYCLKAHNIHFKSASSISGFPVWVIDFISQ